MPYRRINFVPDERKESGRSFTTQWRGVLFKPGGASMTDASHRFDLNTGSSAVEEPKSFQIRA